MRILVGPEREQTGELSDEELRELYAAPVAAGAPWLRVNMVSTVDGAATGADGLSASLNNPADKRVFDTLRSLADAVVVGAGTARAEGYEPLDVPTVLVSRKAKIPEALHGAAPGAVWMATCSTSDGLAEARDLLGAEHVLELGSHSVDLGLLKATLAERGLVNVLSEGGPHLLHDLVHQGVADELAITVAPRMVAGDYLRIAQGPSVDVALSLHLLLEQDGTLLGRWLV